MWVFCIGVSGRLELGGLGLELVDDSEVNSGVTCSEGGVW